MNVLLIDTETSGLPNFREPSDHPSQPHMLQLAAIMLDVGWDDAEFIVANETAKFNHFVKPDGWQVDERPIGDDGKPTAFSVHGISNAKLNAEGVPLTDLMDRFDAEFMAKADEVYAYGAGFDRRILRIAGFRRWGRDGHPRKGAVAPPWFCVLQTMTPLCQLPPTEAMLATGRNRFKPPKLSEAHRFAFDEDFDGAHDAMNDLRATLRLWRWVRESHGGKFTQLSAKD